MSDATILDTPVKRSRKLPRRAAPVVFAFLMATIMAFMMCCVIAAVADGFTANYFASVLKAYSVAMPAAFICVMIVRPVVSRIVPMLVKLN